MSKKNYIEPSEFNEEYYKSITLGKPTDKLIKFFRKIAEHLIPMLNLKCKLDNDACVNYATTEAWLKWSKYDETRSTNIFSYFTTIIFNDLRLHSKYLGYKVNPNISIDALFSNNKD
jgi:hypothetical protein